ncbi:MAG: PQQ-binding-like beta-propeller repeat protein [FCB group bacterium]|nr:PQQ-binding-like beta-propeller repeat protein [FCB group bacterium]
MRVSFIMLFVFALSHALFSATINVPGDQPTDLDDVYEIRSINPNAPLTEMGNAPIGDTNENILERTFFDNNPITPTTFWPPDVDCDLIDYSEGIYEEWWPLPYSNSGGTIYAVRHSSYNGQICTLKTAYVGIDPTIPDYNQGSPDLVVMIADDDRTIRGSVTVPFSELPSTAQYVAFDLSTIDNGNPLTYTDGRSFYVYVALSDPTQDKIVLTAASGPTHSFSLWLDDMDGWYWFGEAGSPDLNIGVDICCAEIPYSECYRQNYECAEIGYRLYSTPPPYNVTDFNMRFSVDRACTLKAVGIAVYDDSPDMGTPGMDVFVSGSVNGFPDLTDIKYQTNIAYSELVFTGTEYPPLYNHIPIPGDLIVNAGFHVGFNADLSQDPNAYLVALADDGACPSARAGAGYDGNWYLIKHLFNEGDANLLIYSDLCKDEYSTCVTRRQYCSENYFIGVPNEAGTRSGVYQKFNPTGLSNRLEKIRIGFERSDTAWGDSPTMYTTDLEIVVRYDFGGIPGDIAITPITITPDDYVFSPDMVEVDITDLDFLFDGPVYVGIESSASNLNDGVWIISDNGLCGNTQGWWHYPDGDSPHNTEWYSTGQSNSPADFNHKIEIDVCYIPVSPPTCGLSSDWPTAGHDFRRTSASSYSTGNARCKQDLLWAYPGIGQSLPYCRPVIYDGILIIAYGDRLQAFDMNGDGAGNANILWAIKDMPVMGGSLYYAVAVKDGYVYFGGGDAQSINRANVYTGSDVDLDGYGMDLDALGNPLDPGAWSRNAQNGLNTTGKTIFSIPVILNIGGTDVLFIGTIAGELWAINAATGQEYTIDTPNPGDPGWETNPIMLDGKFSATLSSNGVDMLFAGTDSRDGKGSDYGTLYGINATTGSVVWARHGLHGSGLDYSSRNTPDKPSASVVEILQGLIGYDQTEDALYFRSSFVYSTEIPGGPSGMRYKVDASSGEILWSMGGRSYWPDGDLSVSGPVIGHNLVYFTAVPSWTDESQQTVAVTKQGGSIFWESDEAFDGTGFVEGALDCQPLESNLLYVGNTSGQFLAISTDDGTVRFEYNNPPGTEMNGSGIAIDSSHVIMTDRNGRVFCFSEQENRPRLRILTHNEYKMVPFFSPDHFQVEYHDVFMNNGCADLTGYLEAYEYGPAIRATSVRPDRIRRMAELADQIVTNDYPTLTKYVALNMNGYDSFEQSPFAKNDYSNLAAYAPPAWLNEIMVSSFDLAEGETFDVIFDVNGPMINRGTFPCYVQIIPSNEQYYPGSDLAPFVQLGVIGGCLEENSELIFGSESQNIIPVFNTGELGSQLATLLEIDGINDALYRGGLVFATSPHEIAFTFDSWHDDDPPDFWNTLVPDINCMQQSHPFVEGPEIMGYIWDETTYSPIEGYLSTVRYIDSVIDYDCEGTGWDWDNIHCDYDNDLTIGLMIDQGMYGAINEPILNNAVIYKLDITNRNSDSIPGVYIGALMDWDLVFSQSDIFLFDQDHSISWGVTCWGLQETGRVYGVGKIPLSHDPMIGVRTLDAPSAMWHEDHIALDSVYHWMTEVPGASWQELIDYNLPCDEYNLSDREAWYSFLGHHFGPNETYTFGFYIFGFNSVDPTDTAFFADYAILINQWAGFCRGDINGDRVINLSDVMAIYNMVVKDGPKPLFSHLADVDGSPGVTMGDVVRLADYWWGDAELVEGWILPSSCP